MKPSGYVCDVDVYLDMLFQVTMSEVKAVIAAAPGVGAEASQPQTKKRRASENGLTVADMKNGADEKARVIDESYFA